MESEPNSESKQELNSENNGDVDTVNGGHDLDIDYNKAAQYWEKCDPTIDGMLGGFGKISHLDIDGSGKFLKGLLKTNSTGTGRALDCGAGIGRITKHLLSRHFQTVDLVEQDRHFLDKAATYLKDNKNVGELFCMGLQDFVPQPRTYDVVWCQWVLGHLKDQHLIDFFVRCQESLKPGGLIVVKENVTSSGEVETDEDDSSVTRPPENLRTIFVHANLELYKELKQNKFPKELYDVHMFALKPKDSSVLPPKEKLAKIGMILED